MTSAGFPHSDIPGSKPACGSPRLIAACHVLLRLSAPRHPPCTLSSLTKLECVANRRILTLQVRFSCQRTSRISGIRASALLGAGHPRLPGAPPALGGADRVRTDDLRLARAALSQLSYSPGGGAGAPREHDAWWA